MPDIAMCHGKDCPLKKKCFRYRAIPGHIQSFFNEPPYKEGNCEYFWKVEKGDLLKKDISL